MLITDFILIYNRIQTDVFRVSLVNFIKIDSLVITIVNFVFSLITFISTS